MNKSKKNDPRAWRKWRLSGSIGTMSYYRMSYYRMKNKAKWNLGLGISLAKTAKLFAPAWWQIQVMGIVQ